ncbi:hypothetical protein G9G63_10135 [Paenibacillus sp. EKM202P]|uniref:hypothetical protein n=2 Tax=unclassified Paenibacillus TaxID=185978 RepID=UPI0013EBD1B1|nr:hypothetical protein [Paenibacillus sp. EKM202P]KAF6564493.1 hypothetical protein G9G63_10135 [Paenibacillus sp. EKM202P]KAF6571692.1 hypothetical protein G9G64_06640 [Paenibacillus sp. EKM207P]
MAGLANMTRTEYIAYLRDQSFWLNQLADEMENGRQDSQWAVDFDLKRPDVIYEKRAFELDKMFHPEDREGKRTA